MLISKGGESPLSKLNSQKNIVSGFSALWIDSHLSCFDSEGSLDLDGMPRVVFWRPEALDCRVLIPPEAGNGLTRNPPSLGIEPQTSCI